MITIRKLHRICSRQSFCILLSVAAGRRLTALSRMIYLGSHIASPKTVPASQIPKSQGSGVGDPAARSISLCSQFSAPAPTSLVTLSSTGKQHRSRQAAESAANGNTPNRQRNRRFRLSMESPAASAPPHRTLFRME